MFLLKGESSFVKRLRKLIVMAIRKSHKYYTSILASLFFAAANLCEKIMTNMTPNQKISEKLRLKPNHQ
jgi:hypothetical protein